MTKSSRPFIRAKKYRFQGLQRSIGLNYTGEVLGGRWLHDFSFNYGRGCAYVEIRGRKFK